LWGLPLYKVLKQEGSYYWINRGVLEAETGSFYDTGIRIHRSDDKFDRFKGKIFLLTSYPTFSAGAVFAAAFKNKNMGVVVGRETGGRLDFLSDARTVEFPNSRLRIMMPVAKLILEGDHPNRGVLPDVPVEFTPDDYINQRDRDIERVKELIRAEKEK
jgi:C-terminal processing protease CtpA/Prc